MLALLPNPNFLSWLISSINEARRSIIIVNYLATLDENRKGPVGRIVIALIASIKRGVAVTVILEGSKFRENYPFYRRLKDAGADVWMDTSLTFIHTKAVLLDDKILCIGSHNLSANALTRHEEASIATDDIDAIAKFNIELEKMTAQRRQIDSDVCREGVKVPMSALIEIKRSISPHAYLLYLLLVRLGGGSAKAINVDADAWAGELGLPKSTASANTRIATILDFLDKKLGIVKFDRQKNTVTRLTPCA